MMASVRNFAFVLLFAVAACGDAQSSGQQQTAQDGARSPTLFKSGASKYAAGSYGLSNPVDCPTGTNGQPDPTCSGVGGEEVEPKCFVPLSDTRLRREVAQTFTVAQSGMPGQLRVLLSRLEDVVENLEDPVSAEAVSLRVEIRELGRTDELDENVPVPLESEGSRVASGAIMRASMDALTRNDDAEFAIGLTGVTPDTVLDPEFTYAIVFIVPESEKMAVGIGCHDAQEETPSGAFTRQMRRLGGATYIDPQFSPDDRAIVFSLSFDDGCVPGAMLECGVGECYRNDVEQCTLGVLNTCVPHEPTAEICDGLDNNCDGTTDEGLGTVACGTGVCANEVDFCINGVEQECEPLPAEDVEICDGLDNTCDGVTDDGFGEVSCGSGRCMNTVSACQNGVLIDPGDVEDCKPNMHLALATELCNGIDDTCDGVVDKVAGEWVKETFWDKDAYPTGRDGDGNAIGECKLGLRLCENEPAADPMVPEPAQWFVLESPKYPEAEQCNGLDNNCNGIIDDGNMTTACYEGPAGTEGVGVCKGGLRTCVSQQPQQGGNSPMWGACTGQVTPGTEVCDGKDNNCNGQTDENQPMLNCGLGICAVEVDSCHNGGTINCADYASIRGGVLNDPESKALPAEICNGADDTCDGRVDKVLVGGSWVDMTRVCREDIPNRGECKQGTQTCEGGAFGQCLGWVDTRTSPDVCNNKDDNCNGVTDEPNPNLCPPHATVDEMICVATQSNPPKACMAGTCKPGRYDIDGIVTNGCECVGVNPSFNTCAAAVNQLTKFPENLSQGPITKSGNMPGDKTKEHWYGFEFPSAMNWGGKPMGRGRPTIKLSGHSTYSMDVVYGSCGGPVPAGLGVGRRDGLTTNAAAKAFCAKGQKKTEWEFDDDCYGKTGDGACKTRGATSSAWPTVVYVKVYRTDKTGAPDCEGYTLTVSRP